jgi:hypothetical protein
MYRWIAIRSESDFDQIGQGMADDYAPKRVAERLKTAISGAVKGILIEEDYIDKDYRSTYYNYYAKKGRNYRLDCCRLHFFDETVSFDADALSLSSTGGALEEHYFGYMVLRPTLDRTVGRTVLSPDIRVGAIGSVVTSKHRVHVLGHTLHIWGFPSMDQHADISVCAHVASWSILRHYSQRFGAYREVLLHEITLLASGGDPGGLAPADGLIEMEAERIFRAAGAYPVTEPKIDGREDRFYRHALAYLESGFPLYLSSDLLTHAIAVVGHSWKQAAKQNSSRRQPAYAWDQVDRVLVVDDADLPYRSIPARSKDDKAAVYSIEHFNWLIVALPEKIYYGVGAVELQAKTLYEQVLFKGMGLPDLHKVIIRHFITSAPGLREYAREKRSALGDILVNAIMRAPMAQFVWVVEYATVDQWNLGHIGARAIIDATASLADPFPVWFAHSEAEILYFDRTALRAEPVQAPLNRPRSTPIPRMVRNLRPVIPKSK